MNGELNAIIKDVLIPLSPIPSGLSPKWEPTGQIRAILFDIYGTLLISGTGDIGIASPQRDTFGMGAIFSSSGFSTTYDEMGDTVPELLDQFISARHVELRSMGIDHPEVDIRDIWSKVLGELWNRGYLVEDPGDHETDLLALRHELAVNPVWPMPGFPEIVGDIAASDLVIGIVSNAQFYTPLILEALTGKALDDMGFDGSLTAWSYKLSRAKPSPEVFKIPLERLKDRGIAPEEILYVGNDMLNDVTTASQVGCQTALFAGDLRSLRLREGNETVTGVKPDIILTELNQLMNLIKKGARHA